MVLQCRFFFSFFFRLESVHAQIKMECFECLNRYRLYLKKDLGEHAKLTKLLKHHRTSTYLFSRPCTLNGNSRYTDVCFKFGTICTTFFFL